MRRNILSEDAIIEGLARLEGWRRDGTMLRKSYLFESFASAFGFLTQVAMTAEKMDHHPDWRQSMGRVEVSISTHDANALTEADFVLAGKMDKVAHRMGARSGASS